MNKILIIPDSFKGTLSAKEVCTFMEVGVRAVIPQANVIKIPAADGGEGTVDALLTAMGGEKRLLWVTGPLGEPVQGFYGILPNGTAVIEMAAAAGLPLIPENRRDPGKTTTYGVGELIADAAASGCRHILLGLGGSATNDFGCGAAAALGAVFCDAGGKSFLPTGETLQNVACYDLTALKKALSGVSITVICDIQNPAYGKNGAAYIFAPQKGADERQVGLLDQNLRALSRLICKTEGIDVQSIIGGGAAGAMGAGMAVFCGGKLCSGIDAVLDAVEFEALAKGCDLILTGEGKFDSQSLSGKVCIGLAKRAKALHIPVIVIAGGVGDDISAAYDLGISAVFSINRLPLPLSESAPMSGKNLSLVTENIMRTFKILT